MTTTAHQTRVVPVEYSAVHETTSENIEAEVLIETGDWPQTWCDYFAEKWMANFRVVTGKTFDFKLTQQAQPLVTEFEFIRQMLAVLRSVTRARPVILSIGCAGGVNPIGYLFDNYPENIFCVDLQPRSELVVACTNMKNYIQLFSGSGEARQGVTVGWKHATREAYLDDDKLWQSRVSVHQMLSCEFIKDYAERQDRINQPKHLDVVHVEFPWCRRYLAKIMQMQTDGVTGNDETVVEADLVPDQIPKNEATPQMMFQFIEETVLIPLRMYDVTHDVLLLKLRVHPDDLHAVTDASSILRQEYTLVRAMQVIPHASDKSMIFDKQQQKWILFDESKNPKPKNREISGGVKGECHFLFFERKTGISKTVNRKYEYIASCRPHWYAPLLRHGDRELQAVYVKSSTFVRPYNGQPARDPAAILQRDPTVIIQADYDNLQIDKRLYYKVGPVRRKICVDIQTILRYIGIFRAYKKALHVPASKETLELKIKKIKKMVMDFDFNYMSNFNAPQFYNEDAEDVKAYGRRLVLMKTELFQQAHILTRDIRAYNNWTLPRTNEVKSQIKIFRSRAEYKRVEMQHLLSQLLVLGGVNIIAHRYDPRCSYFNEPGNLKEWERTDWSDWYRQNWAYLTPDQQEEANFWQINWDDPAEAAARAEADLPFAAGRDGGGGEEGGTGYGDAPAGRRAGKTNRKGQPR